MPEAPALPELSGAPRRETGPAGPEAARPATRKEAKPKRRRESAESLGRRQREISVAEFFQKNRHLLGFDNPAKALLTAIKEAVDNSLDACEEAGILPDIGVEIHQLAEDRFRIAVQDNGPGIVQQQIPRIFGQLLYGSKFHRLRQSRGQQGIGISAAGMYGQLTSGKPVVITSRTAKNRPAHHFEIRIDTRKNAPVTTADDFSYWSAAESRAVAAEIDFIVVHAHPLWNGIQLADAPAWTRNALEGVRAAHPGAVLVLGETGWATRRHSEGEQARLIKGVVGEEEQARFHRELSDWIEAERVTTFFFEAFDENWKGGAHPDEVEKHWGLFRADRTAKTAMSAGR